jgi:uncharacterized protein YcfJ
MKQIVTVVTIGVWTLVFSGAAVSGHGFIDKASVIEARPLYETVEVAQPVTECWTERVTQNERRHGAYIAPIAGGIVGGVLGNELGRGRGKTALTVAGTLLGASIGHGYSTSQHRQRPSVEHVRHCDTVERYEQQKQLVGYRVKYRYEGQTYYTQTAKHPGKYLRVRVDVSPVSGI